MRLLILMILVSLILINGCTQQTTQNQTPTQAVVGNLRITTTDLPNWESGKVGSFTLTAAGGTPPYTWQLAPGSTLPDGLTLSSNGVISGTIILAAGSSQSISPPFTVIVTDSSAPPLIQQIELRITIVQSPPEITLYPATCIVDVECSVQIAQANGGTPPYTFEPGTFREGTLPFGMIVDVNGFITGTPKTASGTYRFEVCVKDQMGGSDCGIATVMIEEAEQLPVNTKTSEIWAGTLTGKTLPEKTGCNAGQFSYSYTLKVNITFYATPNITLSEKIQDYSGSLIFGEGTISGSESVSQQTSDPECQLVAHTVTDLPIEIEYTTVKYTQPTVLGFSILSRGEQPILRGRLASPHTGGSSGTLDFGGGGMYMVPTSITPTLISGTWSNTITSVQAISGTFTLTKQ